VKAAGLAETLSGSGPFTVFAPTNAAFEKLPAGTVEKLLFLIHEFALLRLNNKKISSSGNIRKSESYIYI